MVFLSQIGIKVILPSPQNETRLNHTAHAISVRSYDTFYLQAKVSPLKIALIEIILPTINRRGGWNKNFLGGKFLKN